MADYSIVIEWMKKADEFFYFAVANILDDSEFYAQLCSHFQQATGKYLKAYIIAKGLQFDKVHDLVHLLKICTVHELKFGCLKEECILLNTAYIETRYLVHWPTEYTKEAVEQAYLAAGKIAQIIREGLGM